MIGKVLLVDDAKEIQLVVKSVLREYSITIAESVTDAELLCASTEFDLMVLDLGLPDGSGLQLLSRLNAARPNSACATLLLTASNDIRDKTTGFALGVEDYLTKPFEPLELKLRVDRIFRSRQTSSDNKQTFQIGNLRFDIGAGRVISDEDVAGKISALTLTPFEFRLLLFFAQREEKLVSREVLLDSLWGTGVAVSERVVDSHISRLRNKVSPTGAKIESIYGSGYRFVAKHN